ncbi:uncharacterized protein EAF01_000817 [Botrytis porri]|uniref:Uncharacterized protein n=1 Tax=Botrytis porri TaxID=87229 RepID=A0A4Z1L550_9HELO|nr:uncharacterized protein EAF01_000817 [Botrytis porri]KAF7914411.1 hypothetical protein EAF01_000817 [Botrytis porri]TGO91633.1 hypothetical protein BPOR_0022g00180 [Botrytis porri]
MSKSSNPGDTVKNSKNNQSDSDNPFIRFRHFADEQIGAVLQGFIGLPSAFSKPQGGSQWSIFDEDLKRRDALQARRRELKEAEEVRSENTTISKGGEVQIPVKKSQATYGDEDFVHFLHDQWTNVFGPADIPLYSPLQSPLANPFSGNLRQTMSSFAAVMLYKANPDDHSLLPYLFRSPYSPLTLSFGQSIYAYREFYDTQIRGTRTYNRPRGATPRDDFPYCEAFEDLLLISQGKSRDTEVLVGRIEGTTTKRPESISSTVENGLNWIERLQRLGILHLPSSEFTNISRDSPSPEELGASSQGVASPVSQDKEFENNAETEEQMYEIFLRDASTTPDQFFTTLESTLTAVEKMMKGEIVPFEESRRSSSSGPQEANMISGKSLSEPKRPKREVSSSSTVEHFTNEDGSVETTIRVWKRFDDGSETETTSSHTVDKAGTRQSDIDRSEFDLEGSQSQKRVETDDQEIRSRAKKNTKSGWFWN